MDIPMKKKMYCEEKDCVEKPYIDTAYCLKHLERDEIIKRRQARKANKQLAKLPFKKGTQKQNYDFPVKIAEQKSDDDVDLQRILLLSLQHDSDIALYSTSPSSTSPSSTSLSSTSSSSSSSSSSLQLSSSLIVLPEYFPQKIIQKMENEKNITYERQTIPLTQEDCNHPHVFMKTCLLEFGFDPDFYIGIQRIGWDMDANCPLLLTPIFGDMHYTKISILNEAVVEVSLRPGHMIWEKSTKSYCVDNHKSQRWFRLCKIT